MAKNDYFNMTASISLDGRGVEPPYSMAAEQSVLGIALLDPAGADRLVQRLTPEMFFVRQNREVYSEILSLLTASLPIDSVVLADRLGASDAFATATEARAYLAELADTVPSLSHLDHYMELVYEKYIKRLLMDQAREILEQAADDVESRLMLESAEQKLYEIRAGRDTSAVQPLKQAMIDIMRHLQNLAGPNRKDYMGIPTGFAGLDRMLTGLGRSDLVILAARPGIGKTSFALNMATNIARQRIPVILFSLEMTKEQLAGRILSSEGLLDSRIFREGVQRDEDWAELAKISDTLGPLPMFMDDTSGITLPEMKSKIRRLNRELQTKGSKPIGFVVVDYLQLMSTGRRSENRNQEISELTRNFKIMAKDLNVPIMLLSQLSRVSDRARSGPATRPMLSDLRDSGSIEQDADIVMFLYNEAKSRVRESGGEVLELDESQVECIVGKNRHGETGFIELRWDGLHTRFFESAPEPV